MTSARHASPSPTPSSSESFDTTGNMDDPATASPVPDPTATKPENVPNAGDEVTTDSGDNHGVEGVQAGGLTYTQNEDGTRSYPSQEKVDVTVEAAK